MKRSIFLVVLFIAASFLLASCETPTNTNTTNRPTNANALNSGLPTPSAANADVEVKKVLTDLATALQSNDADAAGKFYSEDYQLITPTGELQSKTERLADMRSGATKFDSFSYSEVTVRSYGDVAVAVTRVTTKGKIQGQQVDRANRATLVLRKGADGWKVVSGQATPITSTGTRTVPPPEGLPTPVQKMANSNQATNSNTNSNR